MMALLRSIDYLGTQPIFFIGGRRMNKSNLGGILSLIVTLTLIASTGYFTHMLFSRSSYNVIVNEEYNKDSFKDWTNGELSIQVVDRVLAELPEKDRLVGITANWWKNEQLNINGSIEHKLTPYEVPLEKCELEKHFRENMDIWRDQKLINSSTCLQRDHTWNSTNLFGDINYTGIVIWIHKCVNSTTKTDCLPAEEIDRRLTNVFFVFRFKDYYFDHQMLNYTAKPFVYSDTVQASSTAYKRVWYNFRNVQYSSDEGYIFPEVHSYNFTNFAYSREATDLRFETTVPQSFAVISLNMHNLKQTYTRKYYKAQNMIADLGGLIKGILLIATVINFYFNERLYFKEIINSNINNFPNEDSEDYDIVNPNIKSSIRTLKNKFSSNIILTGNKFKNTSNNCDVNLKSKFDRETNSKFFTGRVGVHKNINSNPNFNIINNTAFTGKSYQVNLKSTQSKPPLNKFRSRETILPLCCFKCTGTGKERTQVKLFDFMKSLVMKQLDITMYIKKMNIVDKLLFVFSGNKYKRLFENSVNPYYLPTEDLEVLTQPVDLKSETMNEFFEKNINALLKDSVNKTE